MPPEIAEEAAREQAAEQPNDTDDYAKPTRDDWTLRYDHEGYTVAGRSTPEGVEVLAAGWEEVGRYFEEEPRRCQIIFRSRSEAPAVSESPGGVRSYFGRGRKPQRCQEAPAVSEPRRCQIMFRSRSEEPRRCQIMFRSRSKYDLTPENVPTRKSAGFSEDRTSDC